jgi:hypothetical protein
MEPCHGPLAYVIEPRRDPALRQRLDVQVEQDDASARHQSPHEIGQREREDHRRATIPIGAALAAVGVDCESEIVALEIVRMRLAIDEQRMQREDHRAARVDEKSVELL